MIHDGTLYLVQVPFDPDTGEVVGENVAAQTRQTLDNVGATLEAAGTSFENVIKATVYLQDLESSAAFNDVYSDYFSEPYPVRCALAVADLAGDMQVEIDVTAAM